MLRDNLGRFSRSTFVRKTLKLVILATLVWFGVHMFNATYVIKNSQGVHGVISRKTWEQIEANAGYAQAYWSTPTTYDYSSMQ